MSSMREPSSQPWRRERIGENVYRRTNGTRVAFEAHFRDVDGKQAAASSTR